MFKHYYAQGPPAYPDIHIACTLKDVKGEHRKGSFGVRP